MLSEKDIESLEMLLDGALDAVQASELERKIASDPLLQNELQQLRDARRLRMELWQADEPDEASTQRIISFVRAKAQHRAWYVRILDYRHQIAATAACIAVFLIGWQWGQHAETTRITTPNAAHISPVKLITQQPVPDGPNMIFVVRVTDTAGNVVRTERFSTFHEAENFVEKMKQELLKR